MQKDLNMLHSGLSIALDFKLSLNWGVSYNAPSMDEGG